MKTMSGFCCVCGDEIVVKVKGRNKLGENFRHHIIKLSNNTLMRIGVCDKCHAKLTSGNKVQETSDTALANHKTYWANNPKWSPNDYQNLTVTDPNSNLSKFKREILLEKHSKEVAKQEADKKLE